MDSVADTLWQEFAVETEEHLQAVEPILSHSDPQRISGPEIAQLFRSFHSVKGLARALDVLGMEGVAHHAENLLGLVRNGRAALTPDIADLLLQSVDALKRLRNHAVSARGDAAADPALLSRLAAALGPAACRSGWSARSPARMPAPRNLPPHSPGGSTRTGAV